MSILQPRTYSATARVLIEPPAGSDPRASMAVSPVYLELLKTYELFASSDDLFQRAAEKFGLRERGDMSRLKRAVLKIEVPRNTKILEITARLRDPRKAQAMALYIADETVRLNRSTNVEGDRELTAPFERQLAEARSRLESANRAWTQLEVQEPVDGLDSRISALEELRSKLQEELLAAEVNIADGEDREKRPAGANGSEGASDANREQLRSDRLRAQRLRDQIAGLEKEIDRTTRLLGARSSRKEEIAAERKSAEAALATVESRWREAMASVGYRGERLRVIDPGVVPDRPSSPNIPLNIAAALLMSLVLALGLVSAEFSYRLYKAEALRHELRAGRGND